MPLDDFQILMSRTYTSEQFEGMETYYGHDKKA